MTKAYWVHVEGQSIDPDFHYSKNFKPAQQRLAEMIKALGLGFADVDAMLLQVGYEDLTVMVEGRDKAIELAVMLNKVLPKASEDWIREIVTHNAQVDGPIDPETQEPLDDSQTIYGLID